MSGGDIDGSTIEAHWLPGLQFHPSLRKTKWYVAKTVRTHSYFNYVDTRVRIPLSGGIRLAWRSPSGATLYSRVQYVSVG